MILEVAVVFLEIVKDNLSLIIDYCYPQVRYAVRLYIGAQRLFVSLTKVLNGICHPGVIALQPHVQQFSLVLLFSCLLKDDERDGKKQEYRQDTDI